MRNQHNIDPLNILSVSKRKLLLIKLDVYKSIECAFSLPLNSNSFQSFICYFNLLVVYSVGQYWSVQLTSASPTWVGRCRQDSPLLHWPVVWLGVGDGGDSQQTRHHLCHLTLRFLLRVVLACNIVIQRIADCGVSPP